MTHLSQSSRAGRRSSFRDAFAVGATVLVVVGTVVGGLAAGATNARHGAQALPRPKAGAPSPAPNATAPEINWSKPLAAGRDISLKDALAPGVLPFVPLIPHWAAAHSVAIQITDPSTTPRDLMAIGFSYTLPADTPNVAADARVVLVEAATHMTAADLDSVIATNSPSGNFFPLSFGTYRGILGVGYPNAGEPIVGRVFVLHDNFTIDITGPAFNPRSAAAVVAGMLGTRSPDLPALPAPDSSPTGSPSATQAQ
jgi:hypothetical protein